MKADNKGTFLYMCDDKPFRFQFQILRPWLEKECFGPVTREPYQVYLSTLHVIRKYGLIINILSLIFYGKKAKSEKKM